MNVAIYALYLISLASSTLCVFGRVIKSDFIDIGDNHERIRKVFRESSIVNVLLKSFEQPEGVIKWLNGILGEGNVSFVVFNIANVSYHHFFMENCAKFQNDLSFRISYHDRVLKNTYSQTFDGFKSDFELQLSNKTTPDEKRVIDEFTKVLDKWRKFKFDGYIIFTSIEDIETYMGCLVNRYGTFLFIIDRKVKNLNYFDQVDKILRSAWKAYKNFKIFILIEKKIYTFNAYKFQNNTFGHTREFRDLYTDEDIKQMNGYPLYVEIFWSVFSIFFGPKFEQHKGPDIEATKMIYQRLNATLTLVKNNGKFGEKLPNGTLTGALGNLQSRRTDIVTTAFFVKDYETRAAEFTYPLYQDDLCVVVKKAKRIPPELLPLVIFEMDLWLSLLFVGTSISFVWMLLRTVNNRIRRHETKAEYVNFAMFTYNLSPYLANQSRIRQNIQIFIDSWMLFLSVPMRRLTRAQYERLFVATVCLVSLVFMSIYQSGLATVFVRPIYFKDIDTLKRLDDSGKEIHVKYAGYMTDVFPNDTSEIFRNLRNKMRLVTTEAMAMDLVKYGDEIATVTRKSTILLDNYLYFAQKELYLVDECPKKYFLAYMVPSNSVLLKRINEILFDIHRFGFILKWIDDFNDFYFLKHMKNLTHDEGHVKVLTVKDLRFPFILLAAGNIIGIFFLLAELSLIATNRRINKKNMKNQKVDVDKVGLRYKAV